MRAQRGHRRWGGLPCALQKSAEASGRGEAGRSPPYLTAQSRAPVLAVKGKVHGVHRAKAARLSPPLTAAGRAQQGTQPLR